jgi:beta-aspartyl-peptidase (threonine type)
VTALLVASANGRIGLPAGMETLRAGGSAVDAVVAAIRPVEANPKDHSVGYGGLPNLLGEVELDASLMDGRTLATGAVGAVGALRGYQDAILLARHVMEELPHVLIAGDGARRLAREVGLAPVELLTAEAERIWREGLDRDGGPERAAYLGKVRDLVGRVIHDPELAADAHGTVNVIARDRAGDLACGVSTSGWAWKYPGRLGDSPVVGAGNYADNRWGAAACTGRGEMAQRCCTAHSVVAFLRGGMPLEAALRVAAADLHDLEDPYKSEVNIVAVDRDGRHLAVSTVPGKTYVYLAEDGDDVVEAERLHVPAEG